MKTFGEWQISHSPIFNYEKTEKLLDKRTDFCKHSKGAYDAARRYDWINEIYILVQL